MFKCVLRVFHDAATAGLAGFFEQSTSRERQAEREKSWSFFPSLLLVTLLSFLPFLSGLQDIDFQTDSASGKAFISLVFRNLAVCCRVRT